MKLYPAAAQLRRDTAEELLVLTLVGVAAVVGYAATGLQLLASFALGAVVYGVVELIGDRDTIARGELLPPPSYATAEPARPVGVRSLLVWAVGLALALSLLHAVLDEAAALAVVPVAAAIASNVTRLVAVRTWEYRHGRQVLYGTDNNGEAHLYARQRPLSIGI